MTTKEKAKAYDEALNWMRELYPGLHGATKEDAEHYFPELRESEDERIRKELLNAVDKARVFNIDKDVADRWTAWLEKQKEQKPAEWSEEDGAKLGALINYFDGDALDYSTDDIVNWLKSLRPQSKVKLTLLDKKTLEAAIAFVQCNDHFKCWGGIDKRTVIKALSSLKPSWKPSEEQILAIVEALKYLPNNKDEWMILDTLVDVLRKLM